MLHNIGDEERERFSFLQLESVLKRIVFWHSNMKNFMKTILGKSSN